MIAKLAELGVDEKVMPQEVLVNSKNIFDSSIVAGSTLYMDIKSINVKVRLSHTETI